MNVQLFQQQPRRALPVRKARRMLTMQSNYERGSTMKKVFGVVAIAAGFVFLCTAAFHVVPFAPFALMLNGMQAAFLFWGARRLLGAQS